MGKPKMRKVEMHRVPFDYQWPDRSVAVVRQAGIIKLHPAIAQAAIDAGAASPVDSEGTEAASSSTTEADAPTLELDDAATLSSESDGMDRADLAGDDRTGGELPGEAAE